MRDPELIAEAGRWLGFAREDLGTAEGLRAQRRFIPRHVCWLAQQATELAEWAVEARYPGDWPEPAVEDADRALAQARGVLESLVRDCAKRGVRQEG